MPLTAPTSERKVARHRRDAVVLALALAAAGGTGYLATAAHARHRWAEAERRFAAEVAPLEARASAGSTLADEANAAFWLRLTSERLRGSAAGDLEPLRDLLRRRGAAWSDADLERVGALLASHREALELLERTAGLGRSSFSAAGWPQEPIDGEDLSGLLRGVRLVEAKAAYELRRGRPGSALGATRTLGVTAAALEAEPELLYHLLGTAVEGRFLSFTGDLVATAGAGREGLTALETSLRSSPSSEDFGRVLAHEARRMLRVYGEPAAGRSWRDRLAPWWLDLDRARLLDGFRDFAEAVSRPASQDGWPRWDGWKAPHDVPGILLAGLLPNYLDAAARLQATAASRELVRLTLAARSRGLSRGIYPASAAGLPGSGPDPFAAAAPHYERWNDGGVVVANLEAARAWNERWGSSPAPPPPFELHLPPLTSQEAAAPSGRPVG